MILLLLSILVSVNSYDDNCQDLKAEINNYKQAIADLDAAYVACKLKPIEYTTRREKLEKVLYMCETRLKTKAKL